MASPLIRKIASAETGWTEYAYFATNDESALQERHVLDTQVRAMRPHEARDIMARFLERKDPNDPQAVEYIPDERQQDYRIAVIDHYLESIGGDHDPDHTSGLAVPICRKCGNLDREGNESATEYRVQTCHCKEPEIEARPWPMKPAWKFLLVCTMPGLEKHIVAFSERLAAPTVAAAQTKQEEENLGDTPTSPPADEIATPVR